MRRALLTTVLVALLAPATASADSYQRCPQKIGPLFWHNLRVLNYDCPYGLGVAREFVRARPFGDRRGATVRGFRCRVQILRQLGDDVPYERVTCTRRERRVRFYGFS
jgi:hypothetical protein